MGNVPKEKNKCYAMKYTKMTNKLEVIAWPVFVKRLKSRGFMKFLHYLCTGRLPFNFEYSALHCLKDCADKSIAISLALFMWGFSYLCVFILSPRL